VTWRCSGIIDGDVAAGVCVVVVIKISPNMLLASQRRFAVRRPSAGFTVRSE
jgi:hypothetical protein